MSDISSVGGVGPPGPPGATGPGGPGLGGLVNGYQHFYQMHDPGAGAFPAVIGADAADGWNIEFEPAEAVDAERVDWSSGLDGGTSARHFTRLTPTAGATKILMVQWLNEEDSYQYKGIGVNVGVQFRIGSLGAGNSMRMLLLGSTVPPNAVNGIPRPIVSAFNADGVDPTFVAGITNLGGVTVTQGGLFVFQTGLMTISAPFDDVTRNLGVCFVSNEALTTVAPDIMDISAAAINPVSPVGYPNKVQDALDYLQTAERAEKSYEIDTLPGTATPLGQATFVGGGEAYVRYRVRKQFDPAASPGGNVSNGLTLYSPSTGAAGFWFDATAVADVPVVPIATSQDGFVVSLAGVPAGNVVQGHWVANSSL